MFSKKIKSFSSLFVVVFLLVAQFGFLYNIADAAPKANVAQIGSGGFLSPSMTHNYLSYDEELFIEFSTPNIDNMEGLILMFKLFKYGPGVEPRNESASQGMIKDLTPDIRNGRLIWRVYWDLKALNLDKNSAYHLTGELVNTRKIPGGTNRKFSRIPITINHRDPLDSDLVLKIHNSNGAILTEGSRLMGSASERLDSDSYFVFEPVSTEIHTLHRITQSEWINLESEGISQEDNLDTTYAYTGALHLNSTDGVKVIYDGDYNLYLVQNRFVGDKWSSITSNKVVVRVQEDLVTNITPHGINIYSSNASKLKTGDRVLVSLGPNYNERNMPHLFLSAIKKRSLGGIGLGGQGIDVMSVNCESFRQLSDQTIWQRIQEDGHAFCFVGRIPAMEDHNNNADYEDGKYNLWAEVTRVAESADPAKSGNIDSGIEVHKSDILKPLITFYSNRDKIGHNISGDGIGLGSGVQADIPDSPDNIAFDERVECLDVGIYDDIDCRSFLGLVNDQIDSQCLEASIYEVESCEEYLKLKQVESICLGENIVDIEECKGFMLDKYLDTIECRLENTSTCKTVLKDKYFNRLVVKKNRQEKIASSTENIFGQSFSVEELNSKIADDAELDEILPLLPGEGVKVLLIKSSESSILESSEQLTIRNKAVIFLDNDEDGLADDAESYYGTDPNNPDSDGDTFLDGDEVKNGYNPMGEGVFDKDLSNLDYVSFAANELEQPEVLQRDKDGELKINFIKTKDKVTQLSGMAAPNTWVNIFLYSDLPLVMTAKADASGNWSYDLKHSLVDGSHQVFVTVNDNTGSIVKQSNPLAFLVREARAVSVDQYFDREDSIMPSEDSMLWTYVFGAIFLIIIGLIFILFLHRNSKTEL